MVIATKMAIANLVIGTEMVNGPANAVSGEGLLA
jgi:hypothetical protein